MSYVHGIHHVTAICGDAQENLDFYTEALGLRLVKRSINQDAPDTYHLFYADAEGHPGTDLTFFPWPQMPPGRRGVGLAVEVGFAVPEGSLAFWAERLRTVGMASEEPARRFGENGLRFRDPHGLSLSLTEASGTGEFVPWQRSPVPERHQIRGFHAVRLWERDLATTARFLSAALGFAPMAEEAGWHRFGVDGGGSGKWLEVRELPGERLGSWGTGAVHHVAFRVADEEEQLGVRQRVLAAGSRPTPVIDRFWFRSVYFKEPGGVLFELATEKPGFTVDEDLGHLGERLILPPWFEPQRQQIEAALPPLRMVGHEVA
ncbi:MAG TPA: ring-cleaving dioxygenase [Thermoanaerobaculia bacterium]|jgi:glyoxalase family protein|nr:ring-cleaving dioxygenase [Thermoanaerobaculia bacterium]